MSNARTFGSPGTSPGAVHSPGVIKSEPVEMAARAGDLCIVLAKVEGDWIVDPNAPQARRDLGERPKMVEKPRPVAVVWLNKGTEDDAQKAKAYAASEGYSVFVYPAGEPDPLGRAKRDVMAGKRFSRSPGAVTMAGIDVSHDSEYPPIPGMEGPFKYPNGRTLYYDPARGKYYDRRQDRYYDEKATMSAHTFAIGFLIDGEGPPASLAEMERDNAGDTALIARLRSMKPGDVYRAGGGASAGMEIKAVQMSATPSAHALARAIHEARTGSK